MTGMEAKEKYQNYVASLGKKPGRSRKRRERGFVLNFLLPLNAEDERDALLREGPDIKFFCEHCGKHVADELDWTCGYCDTENFSGHPNSFLGGCKKCGQEPRALQCPHCNKNVALVRKPDSRFRARLKSPSESDKGEIADVLMGLLTTKFPELKEIERKQEIDDIKFKVMRTQMRNELVLAENAAKSAKESNKRPTGSPLEQNFKIHWNRNLEIHAIAGKQLKEAEQEYADNPHMLEQVKLAVQNWVAEQLGRVETE